MLLEKIIDSVTASGQVDFRGRCARFQQFANGIGRAPLGPVGINAGFDGELECRSILAIKGVDWRAACDQFLHDFWPRAPCGYMQSRVTLRDPELPVTFSIQGGRTYAQVEQIANTCEVSYAREFGEQRSALPDDF